MDARLRNGFRLFLALGAAALTSFAASPTARAADIVLTAFEPFGGVPVNNSARVADRLAWLLVSTAPMGKSGPIRVGTCILPVEYDRAARRAIECIGSDRPALVLSFGAGGCELDFETRARNLDSTYSADNAGAVRINRPIVPGESEYLSFNAPMDAIFAGATPQGTAKRLSTSAGAYVCNNTAYWLAREFAAPNSATKFGFIHVPPTTCAKAEADPDALARAVYAGLREAMPELF